MVSKKPDQKTFQKIENCKDSQESQEQPVFRVHPQKLLLNMMNQSMTIIVIYILLVSWTHVNCFRSSLLSSSFNNVKGLKMALDPVLTKIFPRDFKNIPLGKYDDNDNNNNEESVW